MCRVKIHRARVTETDPDYPGSMTIPERLMRELDILHGEQVDVVNINNGNRWTTYAIGGPDAASFCLNGAAARLGRPGDLIIIMIYAQMEEAEARKHKINTAYMGAENRVERIELAH